MVGTDVTGTKSLRSNVANFSGMLFKNSQGIQLGQEGASMLVNGPCDLSNLSKGGLLGNIANNISNLRINLDALGIDSLVEELSHGICVDGSSDVTMEGIEIGQAKTAIEVLGSSNIRISTFSIGRILKGVLGGTCLLYTSPSPRD